MSLSITKDLESTLRLAFAEAKARRHEHVTLEHLLYALLRDPVASRLLRACGARLAELRRELEQHMDDALSPLPDGSEKDPEQTRAFQRVLERAAMQVQSSGKDQIDGGNVLVAFYRERDSHAVFLLERQGVTRLDLLRTISHGALKVRDPGALRPAKDDGDEGPDEQRAAGPGGDDDDGRLADDPLAAYTVDLVARAAAGKIDPLVGRANELERTIQVLCRRRKNNPIFVGESGVGKTAIAEGLALRIAEGKVPDAVKEAPLHALDLGALLAGTKFRGQFEERLKSVVKALQEKPGAILFIDEIHMLVGAGATSGGSMDASNLLKPALADGSLRCIGSTTFSEYKASFDRDRALARRFQKIEILEPSHEEAVLILQGLKSRYEEHHGVKYADEALKVAVDLAAKHLKDRHLPDSAIDVIDEVGSSERLKPADKRLAVIGVPEIELVVSKMARVPARSVSSDDKTALKSMAPELKKVVFGQDAAIQSITSAILLSRSGLGSPTKPIGSFLFSGPTGVGKTELARQLARILGVPLIRFDMSEYMEKHTVSRLIGAPPGYVGFDQGGLLTDAIRKSPHAVLLLDEIEKAHHDLFDLLLQVMDHATLTDNNGRQADFRHVVLIFTTNAGAREMSAARMGFGSEGRQYMVEGTRLGDGNDSFALDGEKGGAAKSAIERTFSPEFRNRLDAWVAFSSLPKAVIERIVDKQMAELSAQLLEKKVALSLTALARSWLADHGFSPQFGARPMARLLQQSLKKPLAEKILFGELQAGGKVIVDAKDDKLALEIEPNEAASA
ncbi:MAG TPA: ATP-dependent Clp protease ATP-binding subunit ClpA [Myxococcales bacterium]|jgi:ATP-dependent Clp protease ATP-binding subunit ClpA|nr:ATP-dependent Clp protease ATP-binding subunit ClpA [Myxococcales bacterium]